jgi:hypothetical protein
MITVSPGPKAAVDDPIPAPTPSEDLEIAELELDAAPEPTRELTWLVGPRAGKPARTATGRGRT